MYPAGLSIAFQRLFDLASPLTLLVIAIIALLGLTYRHLTSEKRVEGIATLPGFFIFNVIPFFQKRYDFLNWGFAATGDSIFQFRLLRVRLFPLLSVRATELMYFGFLEPRHRCFGRAGSQGLPQRSRVRFARGISSALRGGASSHYAALSLRMWTYFCSYSHSCHSYRALPQTCVNAALRRSISVWQTCRRMSVLHSVSQRVLSIHLI
jgi:hypothetical protein